MEILNELALFAGVGGGLLASHLNGWRTVCYVEHDPFCVSVLKARIRDGYLDDAPIWDDVATFDGRPWAGRVDIISGGFPCQPYSLPGSQLGEDDERNLWPDTLRIIGEVRPEWCFLENISAIISYPYFGTILSDLAESGFDCAWDCLPASHLGAPHERDRLWLVAHSNKESELQAGAAAHALGNRGPARQGYSGRDWNGRSSVSRVVCESDVLRMADGVADRVDRSKATGNGQVPVVAAMAWRLLSNRLK